MLLESLIPVLGATFGGVATESLCGVTFTIAIPIPNAFRDANEGANCGVKWITAEFRALGGELKPGITTGPQIEVRIWHSGRTFAEEVESHRAMVAGFGDTPSEDAPAASGHLFVMRDGGQRWLDVYFLRQAGGRRLSCHASSMSPAPIASYDAWLRDLKSACTTLSVVAVQPTNPPPKGPDLFDQMFKQK